MPLVPLAILGDLILCLKHGRAARPDVHWPTVGRLAAGAVLGLLPGFSPLVFRATLLACVVVLDSLSIGQFWLAGRIEADGRWAVLATAPLVVIGSALGATRVMRTDPAVFRRIMVLMALAAVGMIRALV